MINYSSIPELLPDPIRVELDRIPGLEKEHYGCVFAVRDLYETVLRVICLSVCFLMEQNGEDGFCRILLSPRQMSFGDWVNALPVELKNSGYVMNHPVVREYLKKIVSFYNNSQIVRWRNDFLGHGLMSGSEDEGFFTDVEKKINDLIDFLNRWPVPNEILALDYKHMEPFLFQEEKETYLLESVGQGGTVFYLNQNARRREIKASDYFREKRKKYVNVLNIMQEQQVWDRDIYLSEEDRAVDQFHLSAYYKKPDYMKDWLCGCLNTHEKGIFLLQGARGTGKSSFVLACDELNQHGDQKISLRLEDGETAVRAYYCNRIDFSNINDFDAHIRDILNTLANGKVLRSRAGSLPGSEMGLADTLDFYRRQYEQYEGKEKLVLFLDGIDELTERGWEILRRLPDEESLKKGCYLVLTCRSEEEEVSPAVRDLLGIFPFTEQVCFERKKEAHRFLQKILEEDWKLSEEDSEILADQLDDRLTALPLLANLSEQELRDLMNTETFVARAGIGKVRTDTAEAWPESLEAEDPSEKASLHTLVRVNLEKLRLCYGNDYFREFVNFFLWIAEAPEGLTLNEVSMLAFHHDTTIQAICFLKDASPFLTEFRSYRGTLLALSRPEYRQLFRNDYQEQFQEELRQWGRQLLEMDDSDGTIPMPESCRDSLLFLTAYWGELQYSYGLDVDEWKAEDIRHFLTNAYRVCHSVGVGDQVHRLRNVLRGLISIDMTLEALIRSGKTDSEILLFLMETTSDSIRLAVVLRVFWRNLRGGLCPFPRLTA